MTNLSLSCYPDRLEYVDQVLGFARHKISEYKDSADLHSQPTTANLGALLLAPINSYTSVLTLLALPNYVPLLNAQPYPTRRTLAHSIVSSVLKNETVIEAPEDVDGILELCGVLIREQADAGVPPPLSGGRKEPYGAERADVAEEQGWIARMVHLFRSDNLGTQFELLQTARRHFETGGDRMRYTYPALITSAIKLCRLYKQREHLDTSWSSRVSSILRFVRQLTGVLANTVEAPSIALRLFLLAAQISDECGFQDLTYDLYVDAFTVYEESISESRAQLQAIALIIGTLQGAKVFNTNNYDTLITKAALHGAKLLKKPHQAQAVHLASHMWWQEATSTAGVEEVEGDGDGGDKTKKDATPPKSPAPKEKEKKVEAEGDDEGDTDADNKPAYPHQDSKRVLECLQKSLRIANSATEDVVKTQLYADALDQYIFYLDRGASAVRPSLLFPILFYWTLMRFVMCTGDPQIRDPPRRTRNLHDRHHNRSRRASYGRSTRRRTHSGCHRSSFP